MNKVLDKPINGWTRFNLGPFHVDSVSYLTEVHWDAIDFFQSCIMKKSGIIEFDCESDGRYVLTYSSLGMELRNGHDDDLVWENVTYSDICKGALRLLTDIVLDFDSWCWWTAGDEHEYAEARDDLAVMLVNFCKLLIHENVVTCSVSDLVPESIREYARDANARMNGKRGNGMQSLREIYGEYETALFGAESEDTLETISD